eukprot:scaffold80812_cov56-Cyclotella_meneghiniana.AAC.2
MPKRERARQFLLVTRYVPMHEIPRLLILLTHRMYVCFTQQEITTHPWFQNLLTDFHKALLAQKISPPWLPDIDDELDTSYFSSHEEKVKTFSKKNIIPEKTQRLFSGF